MIGFMCILRPLSHSMFLHLKETFKLSWPVIVGQLGHVLVGQADNIMIGDIGANELAAASLANGLFFLLIVFGFGICTAISPIIAKKIGAGSNDLEKSEVLMEGFKILFVVGLFISFLLFVVNLIIPFMGQDPKVVPLAQSYLNIISWSSIPMFLFLVLKHFVDGFGDTRPGMYFMALNVILNVFLNWVLIYGNCGFPALHLDGAGWATLLSRILTLLFFLFYFSKNDTYKKYLRFDLLKTRNAATNKNILTVGIPSGLQYFFEVGAFSLAVVLAGRIGPFQQAAHQIAISIASITYMFYMGISVAASIRIGSAWGKNDLTYIRKAGWAALMASGICIICFVVMILVLKPYIAIIYLDQIEVQEIILNLLFIAAIFQLFDGIQAVVQGMLRGLEDVKIPSILAFIAYWIIGIPCAFLFSEILDWGVQGIWWALTLGLTFSALFLCTRFFNQLKKLQNAIKHKGI